MKPGTFKFWCPSCGQHIAVTTADVGTHANCPACGHSLVVPAPVPEEAPAHHHPLGPVHLQQPRSARRLGLVLALVTATVLAMIAVIAYVKSGAKIGKTPFHQVNPDSVLYVAVMQSGQLLVNGKDSDLNELQEQLAKTKRENGIVRYYQEHVPNQRPPVVSQEVIKLVSSMAVPIESSVKSKDLPKFFEPRETLP